jgi:hypothetical protein
MCRHVDSRPFRARAARFAPVPPVPAAAPESAFDLCEAYPEGTYA